MKENGDSKPNSINLKHTPITDYEKDTVLENAVNEYSQPEYLSSRVKSYLSKLPSEEAKKQLRAAKDYAKGCLDNSINEELAEEAGVRLKR